MKPLAPQNLCKTISPADLPFKSTKELSPVIRPLGQDRVLKAFEFGLKINSGGYNIFVLGAPGAGKNTTAKLVLEEFVKTQKRPGDWVYVMNFADPQSPVAISLDAGNGEIFRDDIAGFVADLQAGLTKIYKDSNYLEKKAGIIDNASILRAKHIKQLEETANSHGFLIQTGETGLALVYARNGEPISEKDYDSLTEKERKKIKKSHDLLTTLLHKTAEGLKEIDLGIKKKIDALDKEEGSRFVADLVKPLEKKYPAKKIRKYLASLRDDVVKNLDKLKMIGTEEVRPTLPFIPPLFNIPEILSRYQVNLFLSNKDLEHAPLVFESNPSYHNLVGRIEHQVQYGAMITDFTMLKPGAFHRANGGCLVLDAREVLLNPFSYEAIKRILKDQEIRMEEVGEQYRVVATQSLKPEPIPADVKVVLLGTEWLYYLLEHNDEDFHKLFKVKGEFANDMPLNPENMMNYAHLIANECSREGSLHFGADAVARVIEAGLRDADYQNKLSTHFLAVTDLVKESLHWAKVESARQVSPKHVERALTEKIYRNDYLEEIIGDMIHEGVILIDVTGNVAGQVNGLSVYDIGDYAFGKPTRVTARVFMGKEGLINIERESDLAGSIHNKGVFILQGFFGARYSQKFPISFGATICFEQSYGGVEGDSASSAELFALISAISGVEIRQGLAVTGSVNQMGTIQAVGGINLKIEGFYKTCKFKGLTGEQGVIIPATNVRNLQLDKEVVKAVKDGLFNIYPISTVDEGLEILTGIPAGEPDASGDYPRGTVNFKVMSRLDRIAKQWRNIHSE